MNNLKLVMSKTANAVEKTFNLKIKYLKTKYLISNKLEKEKIEFTRK